MENWWHFTGVFFKIHLMPHQSDSYSEFPSSPTPHPNPNPHPHPHPPHPDYTGMNFSPNVDNKLRRLWNLGLNYLSIPKRQRSNLAVVGIPILIIFFISRRHVEIYPNICPILMGFLYFYLSTRHFEITVTTNSSDLRNYNIEKTRPAWASCQIPKIAGCPCAGNAGNVFPATAG